MSSDFQVGDEVVCVNVTVPPGTADKHAVMIERLVLDQVYVIVDIRPCCYKPDSQVVIAFNEIIWPVTGKPFGFMPKRFRKVQKKLSGMETLRGLLKTKELVDG